MNTQLKIAEAVKESISSLSIGQPFEVSRVFTSDPDQEDVRDILVFVIPGETDITPHTRSQNAIQIEVNVRTVKALDTESDAEAMTEITEQLMDHFKRRSFTVDGQNIAVKSINQSTPLDAHVLHNNTVFDSVFTLGFMITR